MIHLDTNYLFRLAVRDAEIERELIGWMQEGHPLATSAIAWTEFLGGSIKRERLPEVKRVVGGGVIPFGEAEAEYAGNLYRELALKREQRIDCLIAATAMLAQARLATKNRRDFLRFVPLGLKLA